MGRKMGRGAPSLPRGDDVPICTLTTWHNGVEHYCGQRHHTRYGTQSCAGHVTKDRDSYTPGQNRQWLPEPRPCRGAPVFGTAVCAKHGVNQRLIDAAEKREQERKAQLLMVTLGEPAAADPGDIIAERIAARNGHVRWLLARVQALEPEALTWGLTKRKTAVGAAAIDGDEKRRFAGTDEGDTFEAKPSTWYALYIEASHKLERLCIEAIKVGLDERRVRMDERAVDKWVQSLDGMLVALGLNPNDPQTAAVVARHLEAVA